MLGQLRVQLVEDAILVSHDDEALVALAAYAHVDVLDGALYSTLAVDGDLDAISLFEAVSWGQRR